MSIQDFINSLIEDYNKEIEIYADCLAYARKHNLYADIERYSYMIEFTHCKIAASELRLHNKVPNSLSISTMISQYNYFVSDHSKDMNGFPAVKMNRVNNLATGLQVDLQVKGVVFLTTMSGGTPVNYRLTSLP